MRERKYRFWDGRNMFTLDGPMPDLVISFDGKVYVQHEDYNGRLKSERVEGTLIDFAGRYDKNGKEIYESDLVKDAEGRILEVFWNTLFTGSWWFAEIKDGERCHIEKINLDELEVIGNKFANPELLEGVG